MIALAKAPSCSAIGSKTQSSDRWQERFACLLPSIARHARFLVKHLSAEAAEETVQEAVATAFVAYARLVKLGKEELTTQAPGSLRNADKGSGRTMAGPVNVNDVTSQWCQCRRGIRRESLDQQAGQEDWREIVVEDRRATPADIAITRIDFQAWLCSLPADCARSPRCWRLARRQSRLPDDSALQPGALANCGASCIAAGTCYRRPTATVSRNRLVKRLLIGKRLPTSSVSLFSYQKDACQAGTQEGFHDLVAGSVLRDAVNAREEVAAACFVAHGSRPWLARNDRLSRCDSGGGSVRCTPPQTASVRSHHRSDSQANSNSNAGICSTAGAARLRFCARGSTCRGRSCWVIFSTLS